MCSSCHIGGKVKIVEYFVTVNVLKFQTPFSFCSTINVGYQAGFAQA